MRFFHPNDGRLSPGIAGYPASIRELSVQASNGIYTVEDRMQIQVEVSQLVDEVDRIASHAQFNGLYMLTGRFAQDVIGNNPTASMWFHVGANMDQRERSYINTMTSAALGIRNLVTNTIISLSTPEKSNMAIGIIDQALMRVSKQRADLGAYQNRLGHTAKALMVGAENLQAAESRIRDTDMALEMSDFVKNQILTQLRRRCWLKPTETSAGAHSPEVIPNLGRVRYAPAYGYPSRLG
jgi:flagellin